MLTDEKDHDILRKLQADMTKSYKTIAEELEKLNIKCAILGLDDYFVLPPKLNDARHLEDPEWLGPHVEVRLDVLE